MEENVKQWIWQHDDYPNFKYDKSALVGLLNELGYKRGVLDGISKLCNSNDLQKIEIEALADEAVSTSELEGEILKRESVRASLLKKLDSNFDFSDDASTHHSDALAGILIDCGSNKDDLTLQRLHGWHNSLFTSGYSGLVKIKVAKFREDDDMKVTSGAIGYEKIHYIAPPTNRINGDIDMFLRWCREYDENIYIKSALAHLWFVSIHPYDDGNGRMARAITDYILSSKNTSSVKFKLYSISTAINSDRKGYYEILDKTTNLLINRDFDFTPWLVWHLGVLNNAMSTANKNIEYVVQKTKFWDKHRTSGLNERQIKVVNKILDIGMQNFDGGLNTKKYMSITKTSKATAVRDISELVSKGCIRQIENTSGRSTRYEVLLN